MLTTSHYSQSNGNYVLKPGRQLTVLTCLAIGQYCLHRVSDGWLMQNTYLFNSLNRSATLQNAHVVCTRLTTIINHNHVKLFSLSASYSVSQYSVKKKCLRETHYPWLHYTVHSMCRLSWNALPRLTALNYPQLLHYLNHHTVWVIESEPSHNTSCMYTFPHYCTLLHTDTLVHMY